ncbi:hypothetical protein GQ607_001929, partial [Colletotrichum asianum]
HLHFHQASLVQSEYIFTPAPGSIWKSHCSPSLESGHFPHQSRCPRLLCRRLADSPLNAGLKSRCRTEPLQASKRPCLQPNKSVLCTAIFTLRQVTSRLHRKGLDGIMTKSLGPLPPKHGS